MTRTRDSGLTGVGGRGSVDDTNISPNVFNTREILHSVEMF